MVFLILLVVAWAILVLPRAREDRWARPWMSARRYQSRMRLVAPPTRREIRRAERLDGPAHRTRARRREIVAFLASGAASAAVAGILSDKPAAWPICAAFMAMLMAYAAVVTEVDRRKMQERVAARRAARDLEAAARAARAESEFAEAV